MKKLRCVGYVKPMDNMEVLAEEKRIPAVDVELQKQHIQEYANRNGLSLDKIYCEEMDSVSAYKRLCEDAVHRDFDVLVIDTLFCFGTAIHASADFIENVMLPAGFKIVIVEAKEANVTEYIHACCETYRIAQSQSKYIEKEEKPKPYSTGIRRKSISAQDLQWYESRQIEIFQEMLRFDEHFEKLEAELKECRAMIKKLRS